MRYTVPVVLLLLLPAGVAADDEFKPKDGRFEVHFPGKPKEATQTARTPIGDLKVYTATYATAGGNVYLVSYTDFPAAAVSAGPDKLVDGARVGHVGKDGKLVAEKTIEVGKGSAKAAGRELVIDKGKTQTRVRLVLKDHRLYQVVVVGTGKFVTGEDATEFLNSFDFTR